MAIIKEKIYDKSSDLIETAEIKFVCPICKAIKTLEFPKSVINGAKQLSTISIPKGLICDHHFQAFVDKNNNVRGYQKVDYEFRFDSNNISKSIKGLQNEIDKDLFDALILEGNYVKYIPKQRNKKNLLRDSVQAERGKMEKQDLVLKKIYEEFWEFIEDNNTEFKQFIENDPRRGNNLIFK